MNNAKEALQVLARSRLEEPSPAMLQAFQNGFLHQIKRRKNKSGLESAELHGLRCMLKTMLKEIDAAYPTPCE